MLLKEVWKEDRSGLIRIMLLNMTVALTGGLSTVMLVPMLDFLQVEVDQAGLGGLLRPFAFLSYSHRAALIICIFMLLILGRTLLTSRKSISQSAFLEEFEMSLRSRLYQAITLSDWELLSKRKHTDLINLSISQCRQARLCLQWILSLLESAATTLLQLLIALWISPAVTALVLVTGAVFLFLLRPFRQRSRECGIQAIDANRVLQQEVHDQLSSIKETRAYGVEAVASGLFRQASQDYYNISLRMTRLRVLPQLLYSCACAFLIALAFVVSVLILKTDTARLVILVYIFSRIWPLFSSSQGILQRIQASAPAYEKVREAISSLRREEAHQAGSEEALAFEKEVSFDHVCFTYRDGSHQVLDDLSFTLPFGSVTALVGRSGAGKSTTADLLLGLLQPAKGVIRVDGTALCGRNLRSWRNKLGYVPQDPLILDTTIRENLRRFHPEATEAQMICALKQAYAWPFVERLPQGLDTVIGSRGVGLSGGEQQRIVLARVLLGSPRLIILDEATSALDHESEQLIRETIRELMGKATVLIIAHRLATIRCADRAIILEDGHVAEEGPLAALIAKENGYFAGMISVE